jgi:hypothetical protein
MSNATNYHRCIVTMCFHRHTGLYGTCATSRSFTKDKVPEVFLFLSISKAVWRRRYTNQYVHGALVERYQRGKAGASQGRNPASFPLCPPAKTGHGPHSSKICVVLYIVFVSFCYCLCVNVYCTTAIGWKPNCI